MSGLLGEPGALHGAPLGLPKSCNRGCNGTTIETTANSQPNGTSPFVYTDGSGFEWDIGAAAVVPSSRVARRRYLGQGARVVVSGAYTKGNTGSFCVCICCLRPTPQPPKPSRPSLTVERSRRTSLRLTVCQFNVVVWVSILDMSVS
jgi:hypothetical protein